MKKIKIGLDMLIVHLLSFALYGYIIGVYVGKLTA